MQHPYKKFFSAFIKIAIALLCVWGGWTSGRIELSRLYSQRAIASNSILDSDKAAIWGQHDPEAHYARAVVLLKQNGLTEAIKEFESAIALEPRDYFLWLELGRAYVQMGETQKAIAAFKEAARYAPYYEEPRWQLGNALLKDGKNDEAFEELRHVFLKNEQLLPEAFDLAWQTYNGDANAVERVINPQSVSSRLALAGFFAKHGKIAEAIKSFRTIENVPEQSRQELLRSLLEAKRFEEAYEVWAGGRESGEAKLNSVAGRVINGSFEDDISWDDFGFGWRLKREIEAVKISIDVKAPDSGARSLQIDFDGDFEAASSMVSQLVLVEPNRKYRLNFAARTEKLVTAGLPIISVKDASRADGDTLGQSVTLAQGTNGWHDYSISFETGKTTRAIRIVIQRQSCSESPCPIFGRAWLDSFSLQEI